MRRKWLLLVTCAALVGTPVSAQEIQGNKNGNHVEAFVYYRDATFADLDTASDALENGDFRTAYPALDALFIDAIQANTELAYISNSIRDDPELDEATRADELATLSGYEDALTNASDTAYEKWEQYCH